MKTNELTIGDWVRITDDDGCMINFFAGIVEAIDEIGNVYVKAPGDKTAYPYSIDCVEPVPLTCEILEKNGWRYAKFEGSYGRKGMRIDGPYEKELPKGVDNALSFACWSIDETFEYHLMKIYLWKGSIFIWMNYVHELQHALRLCGLEIEIKL